LKAHSPAVDFISMDRPAPVSPAYKRAPSRSPPRSTLFPTPVSSCPRPGHRVIELQSAVTAILHRRPVSATPPPGIAHGEAHHSALLLSPQSRRHSVDRSGLAASLRRARVDPLAGVHSAPALTTVHRRYTESTAIPIRKEFRNSKEKPAFQRGPCLYSN
jgi:hypothetical protein